MKMLSEHIKLNRMYRLKSKTNKDSVSLPRRRSRRLVDVQITAEIQEYCGRKTLRENISKLESGGNVQNTHITEGDALTDEVQINFNMFRTLMLNRVCGEINRTDIITIDNSRTLRGAWSSCNNWRNKQALATPLATARYSASALDRETVCCRFEDQDIRLSPGDTAYPEVDRCVAGQPAQSESV